MYLIMSAGTFSHKRLNFQNKHEGTGFEMKFKISYYFCSSRSKREEKSIWVNTMFIFLSSCFKSKVKGGCFNIANASFLNRTIDQGLT